MSLRLPHTGPHAGTLQSVVSGGLCPSHYLIYGPPANGHLIILSMAPLGQGQGPGPGGGCFVDKIQM